MQGRHAHAMEDEGGGSGANAGMRAYFGGGAAEVQK